MEKEYKFNFPEPFLQKHYEQYLTEVNKAMEGKNTNVAVYSGALIRAVIACGWMESVKIGELHVWEVQEISSEIGENIAERIEPPKN